LFKDVKNKHVETKKTNCQQPKHDIFKLLTFKVYGKINHRLHFLTII